MKHFLLNNLVSDGLLLGFGQFVQIVEPQMHGQLRRNDLHELTVEDGEGGTQNLVPSNDFVEASLQDRRVECRRQSERVEDIEKGHARQHPL